MEIELFQHAFALRVLLFLIFSLSVILIVVSILSAKALGGRLGMGLKKIAGGSILHAALFVLLVFLDQGWNTILDPEQLRIFIVVIVLFASGLLISGFYQIYRVSKELKLFY